MVCKNYDDTIKCMGECQSYFHKGCLAKSEESYLKREPLIENKQNVGNQIKRNKKKISDNKIVESLNKSTNEQVLKNICSLCEAKTKNCFVCGLDIEDTQHKLICRLCKFKIFIYFFLIFTINFLPNT